MGKTTQTHHDPLASPPRHRRQVLQTDRQVGARQRLGGVGLRGERRRLPGLHQHAAERESPTPRQRGALRGALRGATKRTLE